MKKRISYLHRISAVIAFLMILSFFTSTLVVELMADPASILQVKTYIANGIWFLIPLMAAVGITGHKMAPNVKKGPIGSKKKRMPFIALNGLLILVPAALYLQHLASAGQFGTLFYAIQGLELVAGGVNLTLISLNIRDGLRITRYKKEKKGE